MQGTGQIRFNTHDNLGSGQQQLVQVQYVVDLNVDNMIMMVRVLSHEISG